MIDQRKSMLINPRFQIVFVGFIGLILALALSVQLATIFIFLKDLREFGASAGLAPDHMYFKFVEKQSANLYSIFWISFAVFAALAVVLGLAFSHRIAGPLYRLVSYLTFHSTDNGKVANLTFRKGDFFEEIPEAFNKFLKAKNLN